MSFLENELPVFFLDLGEIDVSFNLGIDSSEVQAIPIGLTQCIDLAPANDKGFLLSMIMGNGQCFLYGRGFDTVGCNEERITGNHNVRPLGEGATNGLKTFSAHNNMMVQSGLLEVLQIGRKIPRDIVIFSNDVIVGSGHYGRYNHNLYKGINGLILRFFK